MNNMKLRSYVFPIMCLTVAANTFAVDILSYALTPGSTITPYFYGFPSGPTEPLTGSFDWIRYNTGSSSIIGFDAMHLDFRSESYRMQAGPFNSLATSVFVGSSLTYFAEVVSLTGFDAAMGDMGSSVAGCYSGPPEHPKSLSYPELSIYGDGLLVAKLSIVASFDTDRDGVADEIDQCPGTAAGACVNAHGCSMEQLVPCAGPVAGGAWKNHGEYVSAIAETAEAFFLDGVITEDEEQAIVKSAAQSKCGQNK